MIKKVAESLYAHKSNTSELLSLIPSDEVARVKAIIDSFKGDYAIIKYSKGNVSLIESKDWNTANEPLVGISYCFKPDGTMVIVKGSGKIYHNKWQFVSEDYKGFDIKEAKKRTELWNSIPGIKEIKCKIGNKTFWDNLLRENNIPL